MDTRDERKPNISDNSDNIQNEYDIEEYYDENADKKHLEKYKTKTLYDKFIKSKNCFVISCLIFAILLALLFGPFFKVTQISITGNSKLSRDEILKNSALSLGVNILKADINGAKQKISDLPFVDKVDVKRVSPSKISININECIEVGQIKYLGNFVTVSSDGKILEILEEKGEKHLPEIVNLKLGATNIGQILVIDNDSISQTAFKYFERLENCTVLGHIKRIDFKNVNNVTLTLDNDILVKMGQADKISYKFAYLEKVFDELSGQRGGMLDISDPDKSVVYKAS